MQFATGWARHAELRLHCQASGGVLSTAQRFTHPSRACATARAARPAAQLFLGAMHGLVFLARQGALALIGNLLDGVGVPMRFGAWAVLFAQYSAPASIIKIVAHPTH